MNRLRRWWDEFLRARFRARMRRKHVLMPNDLIVHKPFRDSRSSIETFDRIVRGAR